MSQTMIYIAVRVDDENPADHWWAALRETYPAFARALEQHDAAVIGEPLWEQLAALPGFAEGPDYAGAALVDCGSDGDGWDDVTAGRHQVFDRLS